MTTVPVTARGRPRVMRLSDLQSTIRADRVAHHDAPIALVKDDRWPLAALPRTPGSKKTIAITFGRFPAGFVDVAKHLTYLYINEPTPAEITAAPDSRAVDWPAQETIRQRVGHLYAMLKWLKDQKVACVADIDADHVDAYARHVRALRHLSANTRTRRLDTVVYWLAWAKYLPRAYRLPDPEWTAGEQVVPREPAADNDTARIPQQVMAPLLVWAIAFVAEFADDIFAAMDLVERWQQSPTDTGYDVTKIERVRAMFRGYEEHGEALPGNATGTQLAIRYLMLRHGLLDVAPCNLTNAFRDEFKDRIAVGPSDLATVDVEPTVRQEWTPLLHPIRFDDVTKANRIMPALLGHLRTACLIIVSYLTGMRGDEVRVLEPGCCPPPIPTDEGILQYRIHGTVAKRKTSGTEPRTGEVEREPAIWAAIALVARAIEVAEEIRRRTTPTSRYLFAHPKDDSDCLPGTQANDHIERFIGYVNVVLVPRTPTPTLPAIPLDPSGRVTESRFRRTLAWFIRNQPGGHITLAVQYQHVGTVIGRGYAGTQESGMGDLLDEEEVHARRLLLVHLADALSSGQGVSGPAADRVLVAARTGDGIRYLSDKDARVVLRHPTTAVYDNSPATALCMFNASTALCRLLRAAGRNTSPDLLDCKNGCPNKARLDEHATAQAERAADRRRQAALSPDPLKLRFDAEADELEAEAAEHWASRTLTNDARD